MFKVAHNELIEELKQLRYAEENDFVDTSLSTMAYRNKRIAELEQELEKKGVDIEKLNKDIDFDVEIKTVNQSHLSSECWLVQIWGLKSCEDCEVKGTTNCGGQNIVKTHKNKKGFSVPL